MDDHDIIANVIPHPESSRGDLDLSTVILAKLWKHYPGWAWWVDIPPNQGVVVIKNLTINPQGKYGMCLHLKDIETRMNDVVRLAGELLERYRKRRGAMKDEDVPGIEQHFAKPEM